MTHQHSKQPAENHAPAERAAGLEKRWAGKLPWLRTALLVAASLSVAPGQAAESLSDAWRLAAAANPSLAASASDTAAATAERRAVEAGRLPTLVASGSLMRLSQSPALAFDTGAGVFRSPPLFAGDEMRMGSIEMRLPLFTGGRLSAGIAAARAGEQAATAAQTGAAADLRLTVARAYVSVLRAERGLKANTASVASLQAHQSDVDAMVGRELVPMSDLLAAKVSLAHAQQAQLAAEHALALARADYNRLLGEPQERAVELLSALPDASLAADAPLAELVSSAVRTRPELQALTARSGQLQSAASAESRKRLPQVMLTGGWQHVGSQLLDRQDYAQVGIGVQWQLFDAGATRQQAAALRHAAHANTQRTAEARGAVEWQVRSAWSGTREAAARLQLATAALAAANENERQSRELYGAGLATNTQVLDAIRLRTGAQADHDSAEFDLALARYQLAHAVGTL